MPTCLRSNKVEYYLSKGLFSQWERTLMVLSSSQPSPLSSALPLILSFSLAILSSSSNPLLLFSHYLLSLPYYSPLLSRGLPKKIADNKRQLGDVCLRTALFFTTLYSVLPVYMTNSTHDTSTLTHIRTWTNTQTPTATPRSKKKWFPSA